VKREDTSRSDYVMSFPERLYMALFASKEDLDRGMLNDEVERNIQRNELMDEDEAAVDNDMEDADDDGNV